MDFVGYVVTGSANPSWSLMAVVEHAKVNGRVHAMPKTCSTGLISNSCTQCNTNLRDLIHRECVAACKEERHTRNFLLVFLGQLDAPTQDERPSYTLASQPTAKFIYDASEWIPDVETDTGRKISHTLFWFDFLHVAISFLLVLQ